MPNKDHYTVRTRQEMLALTRRLTEGLTTAYGVGNTYPEDATIIDGAFDRWVYFKKDRPEQEVVLITIDPQMFNA